MILSSHLPRSDLRLRGLLLLLLAALCLLAGVSFSQGLEAERRQTDFMAQLAPAVRQVRDLAAAVDESRGLVALHLLLRDDAARAGLERRVQAARLRIDRQMTAYAREMIDDTDRRHHAAVQQHLQSFWATHEQLLGISRRAATEIAAADEARALMQGGSQLAFETLRAELESWWRYAEQSALASTEQARAAARLAWLLLAGGLAAALLAGGWLCWPRRQHAVADPTAASPAEASLQHLDAVVSQARRSGPAAPTAAMAAMAAGTAAARHDAALSQRPVAQPPDVSLQDKHAAEPR